MKIIQSSSCKNSPKNSFTEQTASEIFRQQKKSLSECLHEECTVKINGLDYTIETLPLIFKEESEIQFAFSITHGKFGASFGKVKTAESVIDFSIKFIFTNASKKECQTIELIHVAV